MLNTTSELPAIRTRVGRSTGRLTIGIVAALVAAPFVVAVALVIRYRVNVPYWDDWDFIKIVQAYQDGTLGFGDFFAQHNEHRILFPNLVMFAIAWGTRWNTEYELAFSLAVAAITFVFLITLLRRTIRGRWALYGTALLVSVIYFSPVQFENWLWGWQIEWFMNVAGLVVAVWALGAWRTADAWKQAAVAVGGATLATFSLGGGLLVWIVCLPLFVFNRGLRRWTVLWAGAAALAIGLYYTDYRASADDSGLGTLLDQPGAAVKYICVYLSHPLLPGFKSGLIPPTAGALLAVVLVGAGYVLLRHRGQLPALLPWLCLASYAVLAAIATASSRLIYGVEQASSSRYTTIAQLLTITTCVVAVTSMGLAWQAQDRTVLTRAARYAPMVVLLVVTALAVANYPRGITGMNSFHNRLLAAQACARTATSETDDCLLTLYPNKASVWPHLVYLRKVGWGDVGPVSSRRAAAPPGSRTPTCQVCGRPRSTRDRSWLSV